MASTSAYQKLRTEQQLGYIVFAFLRRLNGAQGLSVVVQSPSASPPQLDGFIEVKREGRREGGRERRGATRLIALRCIQYILRILTFPPFPPFL